MTARALAAGVVVLALAGCGGSTESLVRLQAQASQICGRALEAGARIGPPAVPAATTTFLQRGVAVLGPELTQLRRLRAPREQAGAYSAALETLARERAILTTTVHDLDRGADPLSAIKTLQHRLAPVESNGNAAWRTLGVPACVNR